MTRLLLAAVVVLVAVAAAIASVIEGGRASSASRQLTCTLLPTATSACSRSAPAERASYSVKPSLGSQGILAPYFDSPVGELASVDDASSPARRLSLSA